MLLLFNKYIIKFTAVAVLFINLFQVITFSNSVIKVDTKNPVSRETRLIETTDFHSSPGKLENNLKNFDRTAEKAISEYRNLNNDKFICSDEIERCVRTKLLYFINITNDINFLRSVTTDLDLRGPPLIYS